MNVYFQDHSLLIEKELFLFWDVTLTSEILIF